MKGLFQCPPKVLYRLSTPRVMCSCSQMVRCGIFAASIIIIIHEQNLTSFWYRLVRYDGTDSPILSKKLAKSGYFSLFNSEIKWNIRENL